jgi:hypothetical protein
VASAKAGELTRRASGMHGRNCTRQRRRAKSVKSLRLHFAVVPVL